MKRLILLTFIALISNVAVAQDDNPRLKDAEDIFHNFEISSIGAKGAVQVSQMADQAQISYSRMIIAQNEEIISLLKQLVEKPSSAQAASKTKK